MGHSPWQSQHSINPDRLRAYFRTPFRQLELRVVAMSLVSILLYRVHVILWVVVSGLYCAVEVYWFIRRHRRAAEDAESDSDEGSP